MRIESPKRSNQSYTLLLEAPPERVFPLFSPILEKEWVPNWAPDLVTSSAGVAEESCLLITPSSSHDAIWVVTRLDQDNHFVELLKITPDHTVGKLEIQLAAREVNRTRAAISCTYTSLGSAGDAFVEKFTRQSFDTFMKKWEKTLNHYLTTGQKRPPCEYDATGHVFKA